MMIKIQISTLVFLLITTSALSYADESPAQTIQQKNSNCRVSISGGEYPTYKVLKGDRTIYAPTSDGIVNALISPDGRYVALAGGETDLVEGFGVMIVNCHSEKKRGYRAGVASSLKRWIKNKLILSDGEILFSGKNAQPLP